MPDKKEKKVVIIGAGPAGLTAAYELCKARVKSVVLEKDMVVGGISRTVNYKGYRFDIGGHRFFTKVKAVDKMWHEVLSEQKFLHRNRISRIYYNKKFFHYPLRAANALFGLGLWNSALSLLSWAKAKMFPERPEETFEQWVSNRFGKRLYRIFFKTYTEKVWGIPCNEITAEWAAQRIKGLSLLSAVKNALLKQGAYKGDVIKTLIDTFRYPEMGPGMMWEAVSEIVQKQTSEVLFETEVDKIVWTSGSVTGLEVKTQGKKNLIEGTHFISSMPMRELIQKFEPSAPPEVLEAADKLKYRDFLTVSLVINKPHLFEDNWIYIHDAELKVGRIQNFKNWSPRMVPDPTTTCLGLEYFCFEGDGLWTTPDKELIALATQELKTLGFAEPANVLDGYVVRMPKAYPVYDSTYAESVAIMRQFLSGIDNLYLVGRNGMHKYNNQDHSMLTAMLAAKNILGANYDIWRVNVDQEYHEDDDSEQWAMLATTQPKVPQRKQKVA